MNHCSVPKQLVCFYQSPTPTSRPEWRFLCSETLELITKLFIIRLGGGVLAKKGLKTKLIVEVFWDGFCKTFRKEVICYNIERYNLPFIALYEAFGVLCKHERN